MTDATIIHAGHDRPLSVADFQDGLLALGFTQIGGSKRKITLRAPEGGRLELPRQQNGRVLQSHIDRAAHLARTSPKTLLEVLGVPPSLGPDGDTAVANEDANEVTTRHRSSRRSPGTLTSAVHSLLAETRRPMNFQSLATELRGRGISATRLQVSGACGTLARDGRIVRVGPGVYEYVTGNPQPGQKVDIQIRGERSVEPTSRDHDRCEAALPEGEVETPEHAFRLLFGDRPVPLGAVSAVNEWVSATSRVMAALDATSVSA